jgi:gas vesicle protein
MAVHRCPNCSIPYVDAEIEQGVCPGCNAPLGAPPDPPRREAPTPAPSAAPLPRRTAPFLLGLFVGGLIGSAALWAAMRLGVPLPDGGVEQTAAFQAERAQRVEADNQARKSESAHQAAESAHADAVKALDAANRKAAAVAKQKEDAELRLKDALARLAEERGHRAALEKDLAEEKKSKSAPVRSFVRDWQLLGPFASTGERGHDTVYPPEREPVQLAKSYDVFGGQVKWRPYHSPEDKIDLADFFNYRQAGVAYAVSWVYSDRDQAVTLGVGSDDGVRVWVNGEKVHDIKGGRQARPGQDLVKAHLKKGWNEVRAKVDNIVGTWELYLEFRSADGGQPLKIASTNSPPPRR